MSLTKENAEKVGKVCRAYAQASAATKEALDVLDADTKAGLLAGLIVIHDALDKFAEVAGFIKPGEIPSLLDIEIDDGNT